MAKCSPPYLLGTGFSYASSNFVHDEKGVVDAMRRFFLGFYARHSDLRGRKTFLMGESYAGHYIPAISEMLAQQEANFPLTLAGIAIGNGVIAQPLQSTETGEFAFENNLINATIKSEVDQIAAKCVAFAQHGEWQRASEACGAIMELILSIADDINVRIR